MALSLTDSSRFNGDRRLRCKRSPLLEEVSRRLEGRTARQKNPHPQGSLVFASWVCARLGGWTGYYGKPGPIVILNGWIEFPSLKQGAALGRSMPLQERNDV